MKILFLNVSQELIKLLRQNIDENNLKWIEDKVESVIQNRSSKELYLCYSLLASKIKEDEILTFPLKNSEVTKYLISQNANLLEIARVYLLTRVLEFDHDFFSIKVANIIEVSDSQETETFLKFLILFPNPETYRNVAVDAIRTNIASIFDAISLNNPYPSLYFNDQQWNQMYLKAAFMQRDLSMILDIDQRANKDLARIISDYAHERWAASRLVDPYFWRPVGPYIDEALLVDMKRLLHSMDHKEKIAGALSCSVSEHPEAKAILEEFPELKKNIDQQSISWINAI
tara:strand:+ start:8830 stop:9690 length:861 start_codon:yes stop_codon:yes gene_type:complete